MDLYLYCGLFVVLIGMFVFASWVELGRKRDSPPDHIRIRIDVTERRSNSMSVTLIQHIIRVEVESQLGAAGLEFLEYSSEADPSNAARRRHQVTYLMSSIRLGLQPIGRLQEIQRRISAKGFPCAITTDPDVGSASGYNPNI